MSLEAPRTCRGASPQKALRGGISGAFLEPLVRFCQFLAEKCPGFLKDGWKLTFEYPHEGPGAALKGDARYKRLMETSRDSPLGVYGLYEYPPRRMRSLRADVTGRCGTRAGL